MFAEKEKFEKEKLPILGKIPFSEGIVEACLRGQPMDMLYKGDEAMKIIEKLQTMLRLEKKPNNE